MRPLSFLARIVATLSHVSLIVLILVRAAGGGSSLLALPLLLPLPGVLRGRVYTYSWACMLVVFYAAGYLAAGYSEPARKWGLFGMASIAAIDFVAMVLYVRLLNREKLAAA